MSKQTPLYAEHIAQQASMVSFCGWSMPLHYGSQVQEHNAVRQAVGMFDVSHMHLVDINGPHAYDCLRNILANDIAKLNPGQAQYSLMLNEQGGIIDDLIVYQLGEQTYRLVFNAATFTTVNAWLKQHNVVYNYPDDMAIIAVQGPTAWATLVKWQPKIEAALGACKSFHFCQYNNICIARTGYTGEDGVEMIIPASQAVSVWHEFLALEVQPCGLGARDTLRLEAGMCLSGTDMDQQCLPKQAGLTWVVDTKDPDRNFIGRSALDQASVTTRLVGLMLIGKGVIRSGQTVVAQQQLVGIVTSGGFSPSLACGIALARIEEEQLHADLAVLIREQEHAVKVVKPPFVRHGQVVAKPIQ